eukprot:524254-Pelagomonas_calceolata.AAC.4
MNEGCPPTNEKEKCRAGMKSESCSGEVGGVGAMGNEAWLRYTNRGHSEGVTTGNAMAAQRHQAYDSLVGNGLVHGVKELARMRSDNDLHRRSAIKQTGASLAMVWCTKELTRMRSDNGLHRVGGLARIKSDNGRHGSAAPSSKQEPHCPWSGARSKGACKD